MKSSRLMASFILAGVSVIGLTSNASAGYLIPPLPHQECAPVNARPTPPLYKYQVVVAHGYDFVEFRSEPAPRGHYVNLYKYEPYDPDMTTADDDPTIDPNMDIDR